MNEESAISATDAEDRDIYTVSKLTRAVRWLLENEFGTIEVEGEISNFAKPRSGHWYFSLKDDAAQVRCAMFRSSNRAVRFDPAEGAHVIARGRLSLYEPRGDFQLIVEHLEPIGEGALRLRFEQLKRKLAAEGLFDTEIKNELPAWPQRLGVITSPSGAAIRDILSVLKRRNPAIEVVIYPATVQGVKAAPELVSAVRTANERDECDVLIITRGGGSLEDLWSFNEEAVARAVFGSEIPIVSAVGHEVDFTICDLVADVRAATPSASAELCSPHRDEVSNLVETMRRRMHGHVSNLLALSQRHLGHIQARLQHPGRALEQHHQKIDELLARLPVGLMNSMNLRRSLLTALRARLASHSPEHRFAAITTRFADDQRRLMLAMERQLKDRHALLEATVRALRAVSPESTLERGYAIIHTGDGDIVRDASTLNRGDKLNARLHRGRVDLEVQNIDEADAAADD